jgi:hypothetical protein
MYVNREGTGAKLRVYVPLASCIYDYGDPFLLGYFRPPEWAQLELNPSPPLYTVRRFPPPC